MGPRPCVVCVLLVYHGEPEVSTRVPVGRGGPGPRPVVPSGCTWGTSVKPFDLSRNREEEVVDSARGSGPVDSKSRYTETVDPEIKVMEPKHRSRSTACTSLDPSDECP